jgi:hypothetical protein
MTIEEVFRRAREHLRSGPVRQAEALYAEVVDARIATKAEKMYAQTMLTELANMRAKCQELDGKGLNGMYESERHCQTTLAQLIDWQTPEERYQHEANLRRGAGLYPQH